MIRKTLKHSILPLALAVNLASCGSSSSDDSPTESNSNSSISGGAAKGILKNAKVEVFKLVDGEKSANPIATTVTDESGKYSVDVSYKGPALIIVSAQDGSMMTCDLVPDCGLVSGNIVEFGEDYPMPSSLKVKAVSNVDKSISVNVTPLTSLAAALAEERGFSKLAIAGANSQVANLFNISGKLDEAGIIDITDKEAFANADDNTQKAMALSAALYLAAEAESKSLDDLAQQFIDSEGQFVGKNAAESPGIDLSEIYSKAKEVLVKSDASNITAAVDGALAEAETLGEGQTVSAPAADIFGDGLVQAKSMVADIRAMGTSQSLEQSDVFSVELNAARTLLSNDINDVSIALRLASTAILEVRSRIDNDENLTGTVSQSVVIEDGQWTYDPSNESWTKQPDKTVVVDVTIGENGLFSVQQNILDANDDVLANVDFSAKIETTITNGDIEEDCQTTGTPQWSSEYTGSGQFTESCVTNPDELVSLINAKLTEVTAIASNANIKVTFGPDSSVNINASVLDSWSEVYADTWSDTESSYSSEYSNNSEGVFNTDVQSFQATLNVSIEQLTSTPEVDPVNITGELSLSVEGFKLHETENYTWESSYNNEQGSSTGSYSNSINNTANIELKTTSVSFTGSVANTNNSVDLIFNASASANGLTFTDVIDEDYYYGESCDYSNNYNCTLSEDNKDISNNDSSVNESVSNYAKVNFSLITTAKLEGITQDARIELTGDRSALYNANANLKISYEGKSFDVAVPVSYNLSTKTINNIGAIITNHNAVKLHLNRDSNTEVISGYVTQSGERFATISDNGLHIVRYVDGSMESIE